MFDSAFFANNRQKLQDKINEDDSLVFFSKDCFIKGDDSYFSQIDSDLFYFSGITQENSILIVNKNDSILFIQEKIPEKELWIGKKLTKEESQKISGIERVEYFRNLTEVIESLNSNVYFKENVEVGKFTNTLYQEKIRNMCEEKCFYNSNSIIAPIRQVKSTEEVNEIKKAITITKNSFDEVFKNLKYYRNEADIEAILSYTYIRNKSFHAFEPIVANSKNACTLHYVKNDNDFEKDSLVLIDTGAESNFYKSDITRTLPVSGKFTPRQKEVYNSVLNVEEFAISIIRSGINRKEYEKNVREKMFWELVKLKLLGKDEFDEDFKAVKKYFPHATSHFLGLDTHDIGDRETLILEGEVLTVEPGIYIPEENIGIRIEDDVLVCESGCINLSDKIIKKIDEIEDFLS